MPVKNSLLITLTLITILLLPKLAQAKLVESLYSASQEVSSQSSTLRRVAIPMLFKSVLVKVSGQSEVTNHPIIAQEIKQSMSYITNFNYQQVNGMQHLVARFNESLIDALLKRAGISLWGNQRPTAMIWLAQLNADGQRTVVADDVTDESAQLLKSVARNRGMPMLLPLWDLEDQFGLSAGEVWGLFPDSVGKANLRYATDFMVLAKISENGLNYQLNWAIYKRSIGGIGYDDIVSSGLDEFSGYEVAAKALVDQTSDFFASQYSVDTSESSGKQEFVVANVGSLTDYAAILNYLRGLKGLEAVALKRNKHQLFTFEAAVLGNYQSLSEVIRLEKRLIEVYDEQLGQSVYHWQGAE